MSVAVRRALYGKLAGDTTLTSKLAAAAQRPVGYNQSLYHGLAPEGAHPPYVIYSKSSGTPRYTFRGPATGTVADTRPAGAPQIEDEVWLVKAVVQDTDSDAADQIASRVNELLTDGTGITISGQTLLYIRRESDVEYTEGQSGEMYFHAGAQYRVMYTTST